MMPSLISGISFMGIREWIRRIKLDPFELGVSGLLYMFLMFSILPAVVFFGIPNRAIKAIIYDAGISFDLKIFVYIALGLAFFALGYYFFRSKNQSNFLNRFLKGEWNYRRMLMCVGVIFTTGLLMKALKILEGTYFHSNKFTSVSLNQFHEVINVVGQLEMVALAIVFVYYFHLFKAGDSRYVLLRRIARGLFVFEFSMGFLAGSKFLTFVPIIIYLIVRHYILGMSYKSIMIGFLVVLVLMPIINLYRVPDNFFLGYLDPNPPPVEEWSRDESPIKFKVISDNIIRLVRKKNAKLFESKQEDAGGFFIKTEGFTEFTVDAIAGRLGQFVVVSAIITRTADFLYGKNLVNFFISLGPPRFLWTNKPVTNGFGNEFGRAYDILAADDYTTSIGLTVLGDWYINFGLFGIILGMFILGIFFRFIFSSFIGNSPSLSGVVIYSVFWIFIIKGLEDSIAPVYAGLVRLFIILCITHLFLLAKPPSGSWVSNLKGRISAIS